MNRGTPMSNSGARKRLAEAQRGDEAVDVEALARVLHSAWADEVSSDYGAQPFEDTADYFLRHARKILASDWLAARDAEQRRLGAEAVDLPDPDIAATGDGRVIAAAINALTLTIRAAAQQVSER